MAYSTLLRIFPGFILIGLAAHLLHSSVRSGALVLTPEMRRFIIGLTSAAVVLLCVGWLANGRNAPYQEFIRNSRKHIDTPLSNNMGLKTVVAYSDDTRAQIVNQPRALEPYAPWKAAQRATFDRHRYIFWILGGLYLLLFYRAAPQLPLWGALALGATAVPVFAQLTCYYLAILLLPALLWRQLPFAALGLIVLGWGTAICAQLFSWYDVSFAAMSALALTYIYALLLVLWRRGSVPSS
ncbi:MAG: hypothetical protein EBZ48_05120 [Proteobacteria bacterium]|nr:hypothetical protein [Pseudomonadota bacterium]